MRLNPADLAPTCVLLLGLSTLASGSAEAQPVTTGSLIREMVDLRRLAEFPEPSYRTVQFSSYDRRSRFPSQPGWFANSDGFGGEPIPNFEEILREPDENGIGEYLICDVAGPGAVVRTWTARIEGTLRVFLDGSGKALYDGPAQDFFQRTYQALSPSAAGPFDDTYSQAEAGYYPTPLREAAAEWSGRGTWTSSTSTRSRSGSTSPGLG